MNPTDLSYWLAGLFEMTEGTPSDPLVVGLSPQQVRVLKDHLDLCLTKVTPTRGPRPVVRDAPIGLPSPFQDDGRVCAIAYDAGNVSAAPPDSRGQTYCAAGGQPSSVDRLFPDSPLVGTHVQPVSC